MFAQAVLAQTWTRLSPAGTPPDPRTDSSAIYDGGSNSMIVFGGNDTGCTFDPRLNDTWLLTNADGLGSAATQWIKVSPLGTLPGGDTVDQGFAARHSSRRAPRSERSLRCCHRPYDHLRRRSRRVCREQIQRHVAAPRRNRHAWNSQVGPTRPYGRTAAGAIRPFRRL